MSYVNTMFNGKMTKNNSEFTNVVVLIPCYNEELSVVKVISDFKRALPGAAILVFDNGSTDKTTDLAKGAGAEVYNVPLQGKGNVIRRMFADIDADIYVMVDGDATYDAQSAPAMIERLKEQRLDMLVGARCHHEKEAYRLGHSLGNKLLTGCVSKIFGGDFTDMLSGFRIFSRRYVKSFPALSKGFETETELTVHALELRMPYGEMPTPYGARLEGSTSGLVPRLPTALLSTGMVLSSIIFFIAGLILETVTMGRREIKRLAYLAIPALPRPTVSLLQSEVATHANDKN